MVIRNRLIALLGRGAIFIALAIISSYYLANGEAWAFLLQFETDCALIYLIILALTTLFNLIDLRRGIKGIAAGFYMPIKLMVVALCFIANIGYFAYALPSGAASSSLHSIVFHALFLALPTLEWFLFDIKGTVRWYTSFTTMLFPVFYVVFCGFRQLIWPDAILPNGTMYPYPYLKPAWGPFIGWAAFTFVLIYGTLLAYTFLNNLLSGKYRRGNEINPF